MNRKNKKRITTAAVLLFFLAGGIWYFAATGGPGKEQENGTMLSGVLEASGQEAVATPEAEAAIVSDRASEPAEELVVYVCGAVNQPGIYTLKKGSRLYEAIALAGGFSAEADPAYHNLARGIADGERIYILSFAETKKLTTEQQVGGEEGASVADQGAAALINLNTATAEQLMTLSGIGEAKAAAILEYRKKAGQFTDIEEIMNVSGIGEAMFEKIKDKITVK